MIIYSPRLTDEQDRKFTNFYFPGHDKTGEIEDKIGLVIEKRSDPEIISVRRELGNTALSVCLHETINPEALSNAKLDSTPTKEQYKERELLVAEWIHLGNVQTEDGVLYAAARFGVSIERVEMIRAQIESDIDEVSDGVIEAVSEVLRPENISLQQQMSERFGTNIYHSTNPLVVAGLIIADAAHTGQFRQNGSVPYLTHPVRCAAIYQDAWDRLSAEEGREPDRRHLYLQLFSILTHDAFEDIIEKDGSSFLSHGEFRATPLFMRRFLMNFGLNEEEVDRIVLSQRLLTKSRSPDGQTQPAEEYQKGCLAHIMAMITKTVDTTDNKKVDKKRVVNEDQEIKEDKTDRERDMFLEAIDARLGIGDGVQADFQDFWGREVIKKVSEIGAIGGAFKQAVEYIPLGLAYGLRGVKTGDEHFTSQERPVSRLAISA